MKIGYARVSTADQNLDLQIHALREAGCTVIHQDKLSGQSCKRAGLNRAIARVSSGDILVVWKLDRLGRSLIDLVTIARQLERKGAGLKVLTGQGAMIDTSHPEGRMIFGIIAVMAEFERELIRERTLAGVEIARRRGVVFGRPTKLTPSQIEEARHLLAAKSATQKEIADRFDVNPATLRRALER